MADIDFISQLVDSMEQGVLKLEQAQEQGNYEYANRLKVFIFDVQKKINEEISRND